MNYDAEAVEIVWFVLRNSPPDTVLADVRAWVADQLAAAHRVPDGHVREKDRDMPLLGTLPVTADGCVVGEGANVFRRTSCRKNAAIEELANSRAMVGDYDQDGCHHRETFEGDPLYSTRAAAEAARKALEDK